MGQAVQSEGTERTSVIQMKTNDLSYPCSVQHAIIAISITRRREIDSFFRVWRCLEGLQKERGALLGELPASSPKFGRCAARLPAAVSSAPTAAIAAVTVPASAPTS